MYIENIEKRDETVDLEISNEPQANLLNGSLNGDAVDAEEQPVRIRKQALPKKRKAEEEIVHDGEFIEKTISIPETKSKYHREDEDTEEKFGKYIASELRNIPNEKSRQILKFKIQQLIMLEYCG